MKQVRLETETEPTPGQSTVLESQGHYLEDLKVGQRFGSGSVKVTSKAIKDFANEFDPQLFHVDEMAAETSLFNGLVASGWHTAAITMKLLVCGDFRPAHGLVGNGIDAMCWPEPVRPGDVLQVQVELLEARPSRSNPGWGIVKARITTTNQAGHIVLSMTPNLVVPRRS